MAKVPIFPVFVQSLLDGTAHMSTEEFGAYCRLLFAMWRNGAKLPNNSKQLARIAGVSDRRWKLLAPVVLEPMTVDSVWITQRRLSREWVRVLTFSASQSARSRRRWDKDNPLKSFNGGYAGAYPTAIPVHMPRQCSLSKREKEEEGSPEEGSVENTEPIAISESLKASIRGRR